MRGKRNNKRINALISVNSVFLALMFMLVFVCLVIALIGPNDILEYENRTAKKISDVALDEFPSSKFQDNFEDALSDQLLFSNNVKQSFNVLKSHFIQAGLKLVAKNDVGFDSDAQIEIAINDDSDIGGSELEKEKQTNDVESKEVAQTSTSVAIENTQTNSAIVNTQSSSAIDNTQTNSAIGQSQTQTQTAIGNTAGTETEQKTEVVAPKIEKGTATTGKYYSVGSGLYLFNDYVIQGMASYKANQPRLEKYVNRINELIDIYPDINFYLYYIERDSDQNYATGARAGLSSYIKEAVNLDESHIGVQEITSFEKYKEYNYKSDHHWAYKGSYAGYKDILKMIKPDEQPLVPLGEYRLGWTAGSFTKTEATANITDDFFAYDFDFPTMQVWYNGVEEKDYGHQSYYINQAKAGNNNQKIVYASFYGGDIAEIEIYNPSGTGSILIFGNSYDNAVIKLIASHFEHTYSVDLRYYTGSSRTFSLSKFLEKHPVDNILGVGNAYYFLQSPFIIAK